MSASRDARLRATARWTPLRGILVAATLGAALALSVALPAVASAAPGATIVGTLLQAYPETATPETAGIGTDAPLSWVQMPGGTAVRVPTADVQGVPAGSTVQVTVGAPVPDPASQDGGLTPAREVLTGAVVAAPPADGLPAASGRLTDSVTVALVAPRGAVPDGVTRKQIVDTVNGPVAAFWAQQTGGAVTLGVTDAHDWISTDAGCATPTTMWDQTAAAVHFVPGPGKHLLLYVSSRPGDLAGCSYALGEVGSGLHSGGKAYVRDTIPSVIAHELGHNFGLGHSSGRQCAGTVDSGQCRTAGYRDYYDVMGVSWGQLGSLNVAQAARLGVLPDGQQLAVAVRGAARTVTLAPLSAQTGTRALRMTDTDGTVYWLEYRTASGQDSWLGSADNQYGLQSGVLLHRSGGLPDTSLLLDGTPSAAAGWDDDVHDALPIGAALSIAGGHFTVRVESLTESGAVVRVTPSGPAAASGTPAPSVAPQGVVLPGGTGAKTHRSITPARAVPSVMAPAAVLPHVAAAAAPRADSPRLAPAANSSLTSGPLVPAIGAALVLALVLVLVKARRAFTR